MRFVPSAFRGLLPRAALTLAAAFFLGGCFALSSMTGGPGIAPPPRYAASIAPYQYPGADGKPIDGYIAFPSGKDAPARVPCLLFLHGRIGLWRSYRPYALQLARLGYGVLYINYYSARYVDLYEAIRPFDDRVRRLRLMFEDMANGVDALAAHPRCEREGVTVVGFSLGGSYAFHVAAMRPKEVSAIASFYGGYNFAPLMRTWDIRLSYFFADKDGRRWHDWFRNQDPRSLIGKIRAPVLLLHGKADTWVPPQQAIDFYALLRRRGVPAELVLLDEMDHDFMFNLDPRGGQRAIKHLVDFLERRVVASARKDCPPAAKEEKKPAVVDCAAVRLPRDGPAARPARPQPARPREKGRGRP